MPEREGGLNTHSTQQHRMPRVVVLKGALVQCFPLDMGFLTAGSSTS